MGGHALKDVDVVRLPARLYMGLAERVVARLTDGVLFPGLHARAIPALRTKPDFGDLDVLITHPDPDWGFDEAHRAALTAAFRPTRVVTNGPVLSFDVAAPGDIVGRGQPPLCGGTAHEAAPVSAGARFQVDLIRVPPEAFAFALGYFSYNDLGNLLGRVARLHGFKLGHAGLFRPFRAPGNESHFVRDVLVTRDWAAALSFLGYDPDRWAYGFATQDEMFAFAASSQGFHPAAFPLEHRSHKARVRDRKRPTYTAFLAWLVHQQMLPTAEMSEDKKAQANQWGLTCACEVFAPFRDAWRQAQTDREELVAFRARFNGELVGRLTGLAGPALGRHMAALRDQIDADPAVHAFVREASEAELAVFLRDGTGPAGSDSPPHVGDGSRAAGEESV
jgi:hypothetical protein